MVFRELSFSRLEYGVLDRLHIYPPPPCGVFHFPWHRHQIEGTNGFYCLIRKTERFTISNVQSQVFTPNNSRLPRALNAGGSRPKRVSYHWTRRLCSWVETHILLTYDKKSHFLRTNNLPIEFPKFREFLSHFRETWRSCSIYGDSRKFRETWQV